MKMTLKYFAYTLTGTAKQLAKYKKLRGNNYHEDKDGTPLVLTETYCGKTADGNFSNHQPIRELKMSDITSHHKKERL